jgi:major membrane immunogen (membrane-anchored lipoprotein)
MLKPFLVPIVLCAAFIFGCGASKIDKVKLNISGNYYFVMYDSSDAQLAEGTMQISKTDNTLLNGTYKFTKKYSQDSPIFGSMMGYFEGNLTGNGSKAFFNMNPKIADNNVFINAGVSVDSLNGKWTHSTMKGIKDSGKFRAVRVGDGRK